MSSNVCELLELTFTSGASGEFCTILVNIAGGFVAPGENEVLNICGFFHFLGIFI